MTARSATKPFLDANAKLRGMYIVIKPQQKRQKPYSLHCMIIAGRAKPLVASFMATLNL